MVIHYMLSYLLIYMYCMVIHYMLSLSTYIHVLYGYPLHVVFICQNKQDKDLSIICSSLLCLIEGNGVSIVVNGATARGGKNDLLPQRLRRGGAV
jgi:hypothetical protein